MARYAAPPSHHFALAEPSQVAASVCSVRTAALAWVAGLVLAWATPVWAAAEEPAAATEANGSTTPASAGVERAASAPDSSTSAESASEAPVEIEVRGAPLRYAADAPTAATTVVTGEALRQPGTSSADVLARLPGVQVNRTGAQSDLATASIRGADAAQVPVYLAGIRLNDDVSGTADLSTVPLFMIERIEVYRGNAPLKADRLGLGGAIFFWPRLPQATKVGAGLEVGSFGERAGWVSAEVGGQRAGSMLAFRRSDITNDYSYLDDQGQRFDLEEQRVVRENADVEQHEAWAVSRYRLGKGIRLTSVMSAFKREQGVTGLFSAPAEDTRARTERLLVGQSVSLPCAADHSCQLQLDTSLLVADVAFIDPLREVRAIAARALQNDGSRVTQAMALRQRLYDVWTLSARVSLAYERLRLRRAEAAPEHARRRSLTPALGVEWDLSSAWLWHVLLSWQCYATEGGSAQLQRSVSRERVECDATDPLGRVGTRYAISERLSVLANVGRYSRAPTLSELYGSSMFATGNPALEAERGLNADLGFRSEFETDSFGDLLLAVEAFGFARSVDHLIRYRRTSNETAAPFNVAEARVLGAELALALDALQHLRLDVAGTLLDARETTQDAALNPTTNDVLPLSSRLTATSLAELYARFEGAVERVGLGLRYSYRSSRFADLAGQIVLPSQQFVDLELGVGLFRQQLLARAALRNVFDESSADLIGLPAPGRSWHGAIEAWF